MLRKLIALVVLVTLPAWSSITFTRAGGTRDGGNTTSHQVTVPAAGHASGSLVGACMVGGTDPGVTTGADSKGNTWTVDQTFWDAGNFSFIVAAHSVLTNALVSGDTITLTSTNGTDSQVYTAEFAASGGFVSAADTSNHNSNGFGTTWVTGLVTPTASASIVMLQCMASDDNTSTSTTSTSVEDYDHIGVGASRGIVVQHHIVASATGSYNEGGTWSPGSNDGPAAVVVMRESGGAPACPKTRTLLGVGC
jgi:hypothetical protein